MPLHLRLASVPDILGIARVGVAAFDQDPINLALFPNHLRPADCAALDERLAFRKSRTLERMKTPGAHTVVVIDDDLPEGNQIVGFAQWESPRPPTSSAEQERLANDSRRQETREEYPSSLDRAALAEFYTREHAEVARVFGSQGRHGTWCTFRPHPEVVESPKLILNIDCVVLGVQPTHQRRGIGKMLVTWGIAQAASQGQDCYLIATPAGIPLYLSVGFQDMGRFSLFGAEHCSMLIRAA